MLLDGRNDAYQAFVSESITMDYSDSTEEICQHTVMENLPAPTGTPISSLQSIDSQRHFERDESQNTQLCRRCSELDFESRFNSTDGDGRFDLKIAIGTLGRDCALCKLLETVAPEGYTKFSTQWPSDSPETLKVTLIHRGSEEGLITYEFKVEPLSPDDEEEPWSLNPAKVDFEALWAKFNYCKARHTKICCAERVPVANLRVFNCATKAVENATVETKYAALSYVWGDPKKSDKYPQTILDAFEVVQKFGLKYIWIDQLCIDQDGPEKMEQIRHMHHIYNNAEFTIAAAAGCDSAYGIPGVQGKLRREQKEFRVDRLRFVESYLSPDEIIKRTTWAKRAWTYQEEIFSKRLLTFTDHGAWFSCRRISPEYGLEHLSLNSPEDWVIAESEGFRYYMSWRGYTRFPNNIIGMIENSSKRILTYEDDVINAFSGCLGRLKQAKPPIHHVWGSPIPLYLPGLSGNTLGGSMEGFLIGLLWTPQDNAIPLKPRVGFPTWSWTGWIGPVYMSQYFNFSDHFYSAEASVALELTTGERLDWSELEKRSFLEDQQELISRFIFLSAWTISVRLELHQEAIFPKRQKLHAVLEATSGGDFLLPAVLFSEVGHDLSEERMAVLKDMVFTAIFLVTQTHMSGFLVSKVDSCYVRVGHVGMWGVIERDGSGNKSYPDEPIDRKLLPVQREEIRLG